MSNIQNWGDTIKSSFFGAWQKIIVFIPDLVAAIIVFVVGWIIADILGKVVEKLIVGFKVDAGLEKLGISGKMRDIGWRMTIAKFLGGLVKWFLILVFLLSAVNILGLTQVTEIINKIVLYIPNVVVAVIILAISILVGDFLERIVRGSTGRLGVASAEFLSLLAKWALIIFGFLAALVQLQIAPSLVNILFMGIISFFVISGGLAFGLGGREEAAMILRKLREKMSERR